MGAAAEENDVPTQTLTPPTTRRSTADAPVATPDRRRVLGLACRNCQRPETANPLGYVCPACFGPRDVRYDLDVVRDSMDRATIERRPPGLWRYLELLPVSAPPVRGLPVGSTPLLPGDRLGNLIGIDDLWLKDDSRNPSLSFKDRAVAVAVARALELGVEALACASTGNLAGATAAAAAAAGLPAYVFIPADLEPAKIDHALAYGATVVRVDGTYDDVNRLCLEVADETGWGFVNVNLRPFYAEGSKTLAFEIAEQLGWQTPDVVVAPIASGAMFTKLARGFDELAAVGLIDRRPVRFVGGQAAGCGPVATSWQRGSEIVEPVRRPDTIVRSLAIGNPADGLYAAQLARDSGGSVEAIPDEDTAAAIRDVARLEGIYPETAGGVTLAAAAAARRRRVIRDGDRVVALLTGNGLKTPDARRLGEDSGPEDGSRPGLAPVIRPSLPAFETWLAETR
jgi:threonine synthase